jgi:ferritin-like metal-binding protein YciE
MAELATGDAKLVQYLNEAYGKERELETALEAHISMTTRTPYRKRLQEHLTETKRHARELERRVKQLGGEPTAVPLPGPDALSKGVGAATELGARAVAAAKGPLHALRGTGEQEKMLKNAKSEYSDEHEEIATYHAIETLATALGDRTTVQLARAIRREEERMASFLARLIPTLTKAVVQEEVPARERGSRNGGRPVRAKRTGAKRATTAKRTAAKRATTAKRAGAKRATAAKRAGAKGASTAKRTAAKGATAAKRAGAKRQAAKPKAKSAAAGAKRSTTVKRTAVKRRPAKPKAKAAGAKRSSR